MMVKKTGPGDLSVVPPLSCLGVLATVSGQLTARQRSGLKRALEIREKYLDMDDPEIAQSASTLAALYGKSGNYAGGGASLQEGRGQSGKRSSGKTTRPWPETSPPWPSCMRLWARQAEAEELPSQGAQDEGRTAGEGPPAPSQVAQRAGRTL